MPQPHTNDSVARYYDSNTRRFLAVGGAGSSHGIHRLLWGDGVNTTVEAAQHVNRLIADRIEALALGLELTVLDMGCGVGGTLFSLAGAFPAARLHGITISAEQGRLGNRLARERGLAERCRVHVGDFLSADLDVCADVIVAVESFVHAASAEAFFRWADDHLAAGGQLFIVDDFLTVEPAALDADSLRHVDDFRAGWRAHGVCTVGACARAAGATEVAGAEEVTGAAGETGEPEGARAGGGEDVPVTGGDASDASRLTLTSDTDLTPLIRLGRPRDRAISWASPLFRRLGLGRFPFFGNMIGGHALQVGLRQGFLSYRFLVFGRPGDTPDAPECSAGR